MQILVKFKGNVLAFFAPFKSNAFETKQSPSVMGEGLVGFCHLVGVSFFHRGTLVVDGIHDPFVGPPTGLWFFAFFLEYSLSQRSTKSVLSPHF
jgi:hypothetical protein